MDADVKYQEIQLLIDELTGLRADMVRLVDESADLLNEIHPVQQASARNLLHYMALRSRDLRPLQARLAALGLSSLGRAESDVMAAVEALLSVLRRLSHQGTVEERPALSTIDLAVGQQRLREHAAAALGPRPPERPAIMVTMPSEAADDPLLVSHLLQQGMDCMRINCAHDTSDEWARMIEHLRRARAQQGRPCRLLMDLAGPKIRTGPLEQAPAVVKFKPTRDQRGKVLEPARVWLFAQERPRQSPTIADASLPVPSSWLEQLQPEDRIRFVDTRGSKRALRVVALDADGCWSESRKSCYVQTGTVMTIERISASDDVSAETAVGALEARELPLTLSDDDEVIVTSAAKVGHNAIRDEHQHVLTPATIGCTAQEIFADARAGDRIWFDDGKIGGVIERCKPDRLHVRVTRAKEGGARLASEKGINLPDTELHLPAMTDKDRADIAFVAEHADLVALSFVNSVDDVRELRAALAPFGESQPAIVLKIETRRGFETLPATLLEAMKSPRCAVMIARGDLAVECGFERLAEVQEEILWVCEAGHVPVIWATQVLESMAKDGLPSRAEVTDAAMSHRAECVMLNKGPYILEAVKTLADILQRMQGHQEKKRSMLRELQVVSAFRKERDSAQERDR
jgi:pyruvate kinase